MQDLIWTINECSEKERKKYGKATDHGTLIHVTEMSWSKCHWTAVTDQHLYIILLNIISFIDKTFRYPRDLHIREFSECLLLRRKPVTNRQESYIAKNNPTPPKDEKMKGLLTIDMILKALMFSQTSKHSNVPEIFYLWFKICYRTWRDHILKTCTNVFLQVTEIEGIKRRMIRQF